MGDGATSEDSVTFQPCLQRGNREMACCTSILKGRSDAISARPMLEDHRKSRRSSIMVGTNPATVGWMCIARCRTVDGALAYMMSRMQ
jgi:hypothetical protein